jgi:hypothetical protein
MIASVLTNAVRLLMSSLAEAYCFAEAQCRTKDRVEEERGYIALPICSRSYHLMHTYVSSNRELNLPSASPMTCLLQAIDKCRPAMCTRVPGQMQAVYAYRDAAILCQKAVQICTPRAENLKKKRSEMNATTQKEPIFPSQFRVGRYTTHNMKSACPMQPDYRPW